MSQGTNGIDPELLRVRRESRHCQTCGGEGQVIVFHPRWAGCRVGSMFSGEIEQTTDEHGETVYRHVNTPTAFEVSAHCICSLGRWMRARLDEDMRSLIPDVEAIFDGTSRWLLEPPERQDDESHVKPFRAPLTKAGAA